MQVGRASHKSNHDQVNHEDIDPKLLQGALEKIQSSIDKNDQKPNDKEVVDEANSGNNDKVITDVEAAINGSNGSKKSGLP